MEPHTTAVWGTGFTALVPPLRFWSRSDAYTLAFCAPKVGSICANADMRDTEEEKELSEKGRGGDRKGNGRDPDGASSLERQSACKR